MRDKVIIFLMFLLCFSILRIIKFIILTIADYRKYTSNFKEFIISLGMLLLGIIITPLSALYDDWWFFLILTFLYFLFHGGIITFIILFALGIIICNLPAILGFFVIKNYNKVKKD